MNEPNSYSLTESMDISTASSEPTEKKEQEKLPKGSALLLDTILSLTKQIQAADRLEVAHTKAERIADMAAELIAMYNKQMQRVITQTIKEKAS